MKLHIHYPYLGKSNRLLKNGGFTENLDKFLAITVAISSLSLTIWLFTAIHKYIEVGIILLFFSVIYLIIKQKSSFSYISYPREITSNYSVYLALNLLFPVIFICSFLLLIFSTEAYARPAGYFITIILLVTILTIEILLFPQKINIALAIFKICLISLSLLWIPQLINPGLSGVDTWAHQNFTQKLLESGTIPEGLPYSKLPVMHLITGATSLITGLDYKFSALFSISLFQINSLLIIFLLGKLVLNKQIGLLAALLLGTGVEWIPWGTSPIPTSIGGVYMMFLIYVILITREKRSSSLALISIGGIWVLILTHTVSSLALCLLLLSFWAGFLVHKKIHNSHLSYPVTIWMFLFCAAGMFFWWIYFSKHISILRDLIHLGFKFDIWNTSSYHNQYMAKISYLDYFLNLFPVLLFYGLAIVGSFAMLSSSLRNKYSLPIVIGGGLLAVIGFIGLPLGLSGFLPHRWWYYSYLVLALPVATGTLIFSQGFRNLFIRLLVYISLILLLVFFSISNPTVNFDKPLYAKDLSARNVFTISELSAMNTIAAVWSNPAGVATSSAGYYCMFNLNLTVVDITPNLFLKDFSQISDVAIILTNEIIYHYFDSSGGGIKIDYDPRLILDSQRFNHFYENDTSHAYFKP
mgnify:CR=1 FL=1